MPKKTCTEKMAKPAVPEIVILEKPALGCHAGDKLLIPTPRQIEAYLMAIPPGETRTPLQMREQLAKDERADVACPLCSGMFLRIVCEASLDPHTDVSAPFWRIVDPKSPLAKKLSCGPEWILSQRDSEA